jgi:hypothetical protein
MGSRRSTIRGGRLGGAPGSEVDRGGVVEPRRQVSYWCHAGHESKPAFALHVELPQTWACQVCGQPAGPVRDEPPPRERMAGGPPKTPFEFLMMRRTMAEGDELLEEALAKLREERSARSRAR